jgi:hypothetical protein
MKKIIIKSTFLIVFSALLITYPTKICFDSFIRSNQYNTLCYSEKLHFKLGNETEIIQFGVFYGNDAVKNAHDYKKNTINLEGVKDIHIFNTNTDLISQIFIGVDELQYETKISNFGERMLCVTNTDGYQVTNHESFWNADTINIGSYELPEMFVDYDYLKLKEGRYPNFTLENENIVEIVVTDGIGLKINDNCYIALNALDENENIVVLKAKVVGIANKGIFLPYFERYFSAEIANLNETYKRIYNSEMIYYPDLSKLYTFNSNFTPQEDNVNDTTTIVMILAEQNIALKTDSLFREYNGRSIARKTGLFSSDYNLSGFRNFNDYNDLSFGENWSIAQRELYLSSFLLFFILLFIITVFYKIINMIRNYKSENSIAGDKV